MRIPSTSASLVAGAAATVGATACCAGPLLLVLLGVGGAWAGRLAELEAYQPYFLAAASACFGYAYFRLYHRAGVCTPGQACAVPAVQSRQRLIFWLVAAAALALIALPLYAPVFY